MRKTITKAPRARVSKTGRPFGPKGLRVKTAASPRCACGSKFCHDEFTGETWCDICAAERGAVGEVPSSFWDDYEG